MQFRLKGASHQWHAGGAATARNTGASFNQTTRHPKAGACLDIDACNFLAHSTPDAERELGRIVLRFSQSSACCSET